MEAWTILFLMSKLEDEIERRTLTYTSWNQSTSPKEKQGWHPITFEYADANPSRIKEIKVECCDCGHVSNTFEPLLDLSLEIEDAENLEEALESFTKVEKIEDPEIKFNCDGCNAQVSVQKQFTLDHAPPVVALHLKRFKSYGYFANKMDKFVKYPINLNLKPFLCAPNDMDGLTYELYAVLVHDGHSSFFGHYYCLIRSSPDAWYMMDDDTVVRSNEQEALEQRACILFYTKQGTPWFSSLMKEQ